MRLLLFALLALPAFAAPDPRSQALDELKRAFPTHVSGDVTDRSDPLILECFAKYQGAVGKLTLENLPKELAALRKSLEADIARIEREDNCANEPHSSNARPKVMTPSMRRAIAANLVWLKTKVRPYVARLESFQRGRPQK